VALLGQGRETFSKFLTFDPWAHIIFFCLPYAVGTDRKDVEKVTGQPPIVGTKKEIRK
jgi:hypothetical protein